MSDTGERSSNLREGLKRNGHSEQQVLNQEGRRRGRPRRTKAKNKAGTSVAAAGEVPGVERRKVSWERQQAARLGVAPKADPNILKHTQ